MHFLNANLDRSEMDPSCIELSMNGPYKIPFDAMPGSQKVDNVKCAKLATNVMCQSCDKLRT